jgi:hypothetical protein
MAVINNAHHAEGLFNPNPMKKIITDFGYPRACRLGKYQKHLSSLYQLFSKRNF